MAARTATVLPAPTSPHSTPRAASATQKPMRATASAWAVRHMRSRAAIRLVKGVLVKPKWATQGGRLAGGWGLGAQAGERRAPVGDVADGLLLVGGLDQPEVVDPGRGGLGPGGLGHGGVAVAADD